MRYSIMREDEGKEQAGWRTWLLFTLSLGVLVGFVVGALVGVFSGWTAGVMAGLIAAVIAWFFAGGLEATIGYWWTSGR